MKFRARKTVRLGPLRLNFTQKGFSSYSIRIWRYTWNSRTQQSRFDTPGWGGVVWGGKSGKGKGPGTVKSTEKRDPAPPAPYRPRYWPHVLVAVLLTLAMIGGGTVGTVAFFLAVSALIGAVQFRRYVRHHGMPVRRQTGTPVEETPAIDPAEAERIVREWAPPQGREQR